MAAITSQNVTITVTGTNDTPHITSGPQTGTITELSTPQPNPTADPRHRNRRGDLHRRRPQRYPHGDGDRGCRFGHHLRAADNSTVLSWLSLGALTDTTGTGLGGSDAWSFSAQDKSFDYLAVGQTVTLTYTVQVDDGHGGITTQNVTITVTGTNDTPVITSSPQTGTITELSTPASRTRPARPPTPQPAR